MALTDIKIIVWLPSFGEYACSYACMPLLFVETTLKPDQLTIALHRKDVEQQVNSIE